MNKKTKKTKKEVVESLDDDDISLFFRMQEAQDAANDDSGVTITLDDKLKKMKKVTKVAKVAKNSDDTDTDADADSKPKKVSKKKDVVVTSSSSSSSSSLDKDDSWTTFLDTLGLDDWTTPSDDNDTKSVVTKPKATKRPSKISLDGVTMKEMLTHLVSSLGFEKLFAETDVKAFSVKPTITSSLKVLRSPEMEWARKKIEYLYIQSMKKKL